MLKSTVRENSFDREERKSLEFVCLKNEIGRQFIKFLEDTLVQKNEAITLEFNIQIYELKYSPYLSHSFATFNNI